MYRAQQIVLHASIVVFLYLVIVISSTCGTHNVNTAQTLGTPCTGTFTQHVTLERCCLYNPFEYNSFHCIISKINLLGCTCHSAESDLWNVYTCLRSKIVFRTRTLSNYCELSRMKAIFRQNNTRLMISRMCASLANKNHQGEIRTERVMLPFGMTNSIDKYSCKGHIIRYKISCTLRDIFIERWGEFPDS